MDGAEVEALAAQLEALSALVHDLDPGDFDRATRCPGWSVAELVAHCEGMLLRLAGENARPVDADAEIDRVGYYRYDPDGPREYDHPTKTFSEVIRDRALDEVAGRNAEQLTAGLDDAITAALDQIHEIPARRVIQRTGHPPMHFAEFVASRNVEFGVHTMDIAHAIERPQRVEPAAAVVVTGLLDGLLGASVPSSLRWDDTTYILTATGRRDLAPAERHELGNLAGRFPVLR